MAIDDAVRQRFGGPAGVARLRKTPKLALAKSPDASPQDPISPSWVVAGVMTLDGVILSACAAVVIMLCSGHDSGFAAGKWLLVAIATVITALDVPRRLLGNAISSIRDFRSRLARMMLAVLAGGAAGTLCLALIASFSLAWQVWLPTWLGVSLPVSVVAAILSARKVGGLYADGRLARHVAIIGNAPFAESFAQELREQPSGIVRFAGTFGDDDAGVSVAGMRAQTGGSRIDSVVLCVPIIQAERIARLRAQLRELNCDIYLADDLLDRTAAPGMLELVGRQRVLKIGQRPLNDWQLVQKVVFDRVVAAVMLAALAPLLLAIALAISLDSDGPILFRQPRIGLNNRIFTMFKFRTMYHDRADLHCHLQTTRDDRRVTRLGRLLRRTSLDELPQLFNVLAGTMSLVGPRPHAAATKAGGLLFHDVVADYPLRHRVKPGITGWAQVRGWRGETSTFDQIEQRVAHDLYYIDHWSLMFDVRIIVLTIGALWNSKAAF